MDRWMSWTGVSCPKVSRTWLPCEVAITSYMKRRVSGAKLVTGVYTASPCDLVRRYVIVNVSVIHPQGLIEVAATPHAVAEQIVRVHLDQAAHLEAQIGASGELARRRHEGFDLGRQPWYLAPLEACLLETCLAQQLRRFDALPAQRVEQQDEIAHRAALGGSRHGVSPGVRVFTHLAGIVMPASGTAIARIERRADDLAQRTKSQPCPASEPDAS